MHLTTDSSKINGYWFLSMISDVMHYYDDIRSGTGLDYHTPLRLPPKPVLVTGTDGGVWS
jgi:hypothetical protein